MNLVGNGLKFTERGGITVRVRQMVHRNTRARLRFEVADTGMGMTSEEQAFLFQPFTQANTSIARKHGGTGLGLAISRRILDLLGGQIGVVSERGQGSTFWFEFEAEIAALTDTAPSQPTVFASQGAGDAPLLKRTGSAAAGRPLRILVAEDQETNRRLVLLMLEKLGYRADVASNGREAVEAWDRSRHDVILMDCQMPECDGFEATRLIRQRAAASADALAPMVCIVALTANALAGDREKCLAAGMDGYLSKPVRMDALAAALGHLPGADRKPTLVSESPAVIGQHLTQLREELGVEGALEVLASFLQDTPLRLADMRSLMAQSDRKTFGRHAHSLAGSCAIFGLENMRTTALRLEDWAEAGQSPQLESGVAELERLFASVRELLETQRRAMLVAQPL